MPDEAKKTPSFQVAQPAIPGVPSRAAEPSAATAAARLKGRPPYLWACGGGGILVLTIALVWWAHGLAGAHVAPAVTAPAPLPEISAKQPAERLPVAPGKIATTLEMKEPWSTKKFLYRTSTGDAFPALLVHLHGDEYWAFSLREPYGTCELEFASVEKLRTYYDLEAKYPMVGDPCNRSVYDLTRYSNGPNGLVRGGLVAGVGGQRPPLAIEVDVRGNEIVASRSE